MFSPSEEANCRQLIALALREDLDERGDVTSAAVLPAGLQGRAVFRLKSAGVIAGMPAAALTVETLAPGVKLEAFCPEGAVLSAGELIGRVTGPLHGILAAERTTLNFLQHLSGIASMTRRFVDAVVGLPVQILDTRKTLPGWRLLAKYAVRCGGGHNHRLGLYDGMLIKDNHLAALPLAASTGAEPGAKIQEAVRRARRAQPDLPIEIEVDSLEQLDAALACRPAIVLLDNMPPDMLREAVRRRDASARDIQLEASGGIKLTTVRAVAETGVDRISVGALTHSAPALDIALDYET
jgi:nicotinate-nucleotide pyrophosphorylase (carboxylating)